MGSGDVLNNCGVEFPLLSSASAEVVRWYAQPPCKKTYNCPSQSSANALLGMLLYIDFLVLLFYPKIKTGNKIFWFEPQITPLAF